MKIIVAVDKEWGIGYKGDLLIRIKNDLLNFKSLTVGKTVICGSNTVATFPGGRALKNRTSIAAVAALATALVPVFENALGSLLEDVNTGR